jgi:hypothetical protein
MTNAKIQSKIKKLKKIEESARKLRDKLEKLELDFCEIKNNDFIFSNAWHDYCQKNNLNIYYTFQDVLS